MNRIIRIILLLLFRCLPGTFLIHGSGVFFLIGFCILVTVGYFVNLK